MQFARIIAAALILSIATPSAQAEPNVSAEQEHAFPSISWSDWVTMKVIACTSTALTTGVISTMLFLKQRVAQRFLAPGEILGPIARAALELGLRVRADGTLAQWGRLPEETKIAFLNLVKLYATGTHN